ncbi:MAG: hypothetical protein KDC79_03805 [Cyclobacteriaceae bacterium]|nr:hypothetical protein [Cyclobacteriaceae bacterium]
MVRSVSKEDSLWINFAHALEIKDTKFLIENSLDSVQCAECIFLSNHETEVYASSFVYDQPDRIEKLMHIDSLSDQDFSTFVEGDRLVVNYKVKSIYAEEGGYNLIFLFIKTSKGYRFKGMILT